MKYYPVQVIRDDINPLYIILYKATVIKQTNIVHGFRKAVVFFFRDSCWDLHLSLEVQPPFFIGWFPNHHYFSRGLSSSKRNRHFLNGGWLPGLLGMILAAKTSQWNIGGSWVPESLTGDGHRWGGGVDLVWKRLGNDWSPGIPKFLVDSKSVDFWSWESKGTPPNATPPPRNSRPF